MKLSIITVTHNAAATIKVCLQSVFEQTFPAEQIIVDGASTDNTVALVRHYSPEALIISEPDKGIYDAMNKGIALSTGDIIGILNADDFYASPDVLAKVAAVFEDSTVMSCYGDLEYVKAAECKASGHVSPFPLDSKSFKIVRSWKSGVFSPEKFYHGWMPPHPTFFVRRSVYEKFGTFRLDLGTAADYELMLRLLLKERISCDYIPAVLVRMRAGGASNRSLAARLKANRMDHKAWKVNDLQPHPWTLLSKPLRKISQWFV